MPTATELREIRKTNIGHLIRECGSSSELNRRLGRRANDNELYKTFNNKCDNDSAYAQSKQTMAVRELERTLGLPEGMLDEPHKEISLNPLKLVMEHELRRRSKVAAAYTQAAAAAEADRMFDDLFADKFIQGGLPLQPKKSVVAAPRANTRRLILKHGELAKMRPQPRRGIRLKAIAPQTVSDTVAATSEQTVVQTVDETVSRTAAETVPETVSAKPQKPAVGRHQTTLPE